MSADRPPPNDVPNPFTIEETGLFELLLEQAGTIGELSEESDGYAMRALRYEEGVCCLQWTCSKVERASQGSASIKASALTRCLGELVAFAETGREPGWLKAARLEMGR